MKKKRIAIFGNGWNNEYLKQFMKGVEEEARKDHVDLFVYLTYIFWGDTPMQSKCQLNIFHLPKPKDYDGAIVLSNTFNLPDEADRVLNLFHKAGVPMISTEVEVPGLPFIGTGNYEGIHDLAVHLIEEHNVKNVVYIAGIEGHPECAIRHQALVDALKEHGLPEPPVLYGNFGFIAAAQEVTKWIQEGKPLPDAFVCANDHEAIAVSTTLQQFGYDVPGDVIVTGFDQIEQARTTLPLIATVSRRWEDLGRNAYLELKNQIISPDPSFHKVYPSEFIPSESCGCKPGKASVDYRLNKFRNLYYDNNKTDTWHIFFQHMRLGLSRVDSLEMLNRVGTPFFGHPDFLNGDYAILAEPSFFELDDEHYPKRIRGYSKEMKVIYERRDGISYPISDFVNKGIPYPNYSKNSEESNTYYFLPLNHQEYVIGYIALKNLPDTIYTMMMYSCIGNLNSMFIMIRNYIFAQRTNRELRRISRTDYLTEMNNRTGLNDILVPFVEEQKALGNSVQILFADINRMKTINDIYGHLNGDVAIKATADAMRHVLPEGWLFARFGGDELVAVGLCESEKAAEGLRSKLDIGINTYVASQNLCFPLTVSVGSTIVTPADEGTMDDFVKRADESMYDEKEKAHKILDAIPPTQRK